MKALWQGRPRISSCANPYQRWSWVLLVGGDRSLVCVIVSAMCVRRVRRVISSL